MGALLNEIRGPADVKRLTPAQLPTLAREIRDFIVTTVCGTGGHLGPNLGVVELTIAVHRVFDSPRDVLLWDTGHQAYVHKLLTGRAAAFQRLRQTDGLSGYPSRAESEHDVIENSHASTALSYADGLAKAFSLRGETDRAVVAVVGDGALTGGMCWEALNNITAAKERSVIVVVNDNGRSYAPTVGGLVGHLAALGLRYIGPVDGHDVRAMERALRDARALCGPVVVHCRTRKGCGYPPAERDDADCLHGVGVVDPVTGHASGPTARTWTHVFADEIAAIGDERPDVVAVTAAMLRPVGLHPFACAHPDRVFDVGIAEQHAVTSAAGLATGGLHPVVCLYATFLNRAFDQVLMDVALHRLPVTFVLDRAGVTGDDGPSHNGMWDLSILGVVPGLSVAAPRDASRLRQLLREAIDIPAPTALRFPKAAVEAEIPSLDTVGRTDVLRDAQRDDVLVVAVGAMARSALQAAELLAARGIGATVVDPRWVQPVDSALIAMAAAHQAVAVVEDNGRAGGVGSAVARALAEHDIDVPVRALGLPQQFLAQGKRAEVLAHCGLTPALLAERVTAALDAPVPVALPATNALVRGLR